MNYKYPVGTVIKTSDSTITILNQDLYGTIMYGPKFAAPGYKISVAHDPGSPWAGTDYTSFVDQAVLEMTIAVNGKKPFATPPANVAATTTTTTITLEDPHKGHDVTDNKVLGKSWQYCRDCWKHFRTTSPATTTTTTITLEDPHKSHDVIDNEVLGKSFKYCRDCKREVS